MTKVRILSKKQNGATVKTGWITPQVAKGMVKLLQREYPKDKHIILTKERKRATQR